MPSESFPRRSFGVSWCGADALDGRDTETKVAEPHRFCRGKVPGCKHLQLVRCAVRTGGIDDDDEILVAGNETEFHRMLLVVHASCLVLHHFVHIPVSRR